MCKMIKGVIWSVTRDSDSLLAALFLATDRMDTNNNFKSQMFVRTTINLIKGVTTPICIDINMLYNALIEHPQIQGDIASFMFITLLTGCDYVIGYNIFKDTFYKTLRGIGAKYVLELWLQYRTRIGVLNLYL